MALSLPSSSSFNTSNALAADARSLDRLKFAAGSSPEATREAAKQFESLFMREMIKSMREATMKSGLLDSAQGDLSTDLLDQQLSVQMSGQPGGLSEAIARQLSQAMGGAAVQLAPPATLSLATPVLRTQTTTPTPLASGPAPQGRPAAGQDRRRAASPGQDHAPGEDAPTASQEGRRHHPRDSVLIRAESGVS